MSRYFMELSYKGTHYKGFQVQENAHTVQGEIEQALKILQREEIHLTGSSRTDAGVHALQNYFHFDYEGDLLPTLVYKLNAILSRDIAIKRVFQVGEEAHSRFDAIYREYRYYLARERDPFLQDRSWYYPYTIDRGLLDQAASVLMEYQDFTSFSKRNTQAKTALCRLEVSQWVEEGDCLIYQVRANRFLRGMVRALVATMLLVARGKMSIAEFRQVIEARDCTRASFAAPGLGLYLVEVGFPQAYFPDQPIRKNEPGSL